MSLAKILNVDTDKIELYQVKKGELRQITVYVDEDDTLDEVVEELNDFINQGSLRIIKYLGNHPFVPHSENRLKVAKDMFEYSSSQIVRDKNKYILLDANDKPQYEGYFLTSNEEDLDKDFRSKEPDDFFISLELIEELESYGKW